MAQITTIMTPANIDAALRDLDAELSGITELAGLWSTLPDDQRIDYQVEWYDLMGQFEALACIDRASGLSSTQVQRYHAILAHYAEVRSIIQQLDLALPAFPGS